jgi:glycosyltransferase involved in cell wall biosynthesis
MGLKLSIIVPIYKVEQYLGKCVDSLLNQDLPHEEYEIILVDDGSPDGCPAMCDEYASTHDNVRVVHRENGGLSAARNSGIEVAQGQYVQFVDSDDYLEPNVLKTLVDKMDADHLDILRFNYQNVNEKYEVFEPNKVSKPFVDYRDEVCDGLTFLNERLGYGCYAWQFVLRRELLENCVFKEGIYFEDMEWTPRLLLKASKVTSTDLMVYNYLMREGSITQSVDEKKKIKVLDDRLSLIASMKRQMEKASDKRWFEGMIGQMTIGIISSASSDFWEMRKELIMRIKREGVFPLSSYHATDLAARKIRLANISPMLCCLLLHAKNK